ncbi:MAG: DMT family transporter [Chloroflexi bacterium]|nr:DMT family transporter [Chloroflexota bacterium]
MSHSQKPARAVSIWPYVWLGVLGHAIWGGYPVMAKRAIADVPKFSLLFLASTAATLMGLWLVRHHDRMSWRAMWRGMRYEPMMWGLAFFVVARSVSNIMAISLTQAVWVQLIYMLTPFLVALLGLLLFRDPAPPYTFRALFFSSVGAVLMLVEDWSQVLTAFTPRDLAGLAVAFFSALALAMYFQMVRRSQLREATRGLIMVQQGVAMAATFLALSLFNGEDWSRWATASTGGLWAALAAIFVVQVGGNLVQITALGGVNPALITSMMALRLISALVLGGLILGEHLTQPTQWLGAVIVTITVTIYLWLQNMRHGPREP